MKDRYDISVLESEKYYLHASKHSSIVKQILDEQRMFLSDGYRDMGYLKETMKDYNNIISLIAKLIKELKLENNGVVLSILLRKLILDGYFSINNSFCASTSGWFYDSNFLEGLDIVCGSGCCRHLTSFNCDVFKKIGVFNKKINCYYGNDGETLKQVFSMCSNHAANLIKYDDTIYGYNCYENVLFETIDGFTMMEIADINKKTKCNLFYKPASTIMTSDISYDEAINFIKVLKENSKNRMITYEDYLSLKEFAKTIFNNNFEMFQDLKSDVSEHVKKLTRHLMYEYGEMIDDLHG